jgi:hypothetical protein
LLWGEGACGEDLKTAFIAADCAGGRSAKEVGEGWFGGVDALNLIYVCRVYGGCEGAEEESSRREGGRDGVCM